MNNFNPTKEQNEAGEIFLNLGSSQDNTIKEIAEMIKNAVGFTGKMNWDKSKPDGTPQKLLDVIKIQQLGWKNKINFEAGIKLTYDWYKNNYGNNN